LLLSQAAAQLFCHLATTQGVRRSLVRALLEKGKYNGKNTR
jgi:hypothetical protein